MAVSGLENKLQSKLDDASGGGRIYPSKGGWYTHVKIWISEVDMIEGIKGLDSELERFFLGNPCVFEQREVKIDCSGAHDDTFARGSISGIRRVDERACVKPARQSALIAWEIGGFSC